MNNNVVTIQLVNREGEVTEINLDPKASPESKQFCDEWKYFLKHGKFQKNAKYFKNT